MSQHRESNKARRVCLVVELCDLPKTNRAKQRRAGQDIE